LDPENPQEERFPPHFRLESYLGGKEGRVFEKVLLKFEKDIVVSKRIFLESINFDINN
jgi:hypothetical protein